MNYETELNLRTKAEATDALVLARIRLVLAIAALLNTVIEPLGMPGFTGFVFGGYVLHSLVVYLLSHQSRPFWRCKLIHWVDAFWYAFMVFCDGSSINIFFTLFFLVITTSSFRWGAEEGRRVTLGSSILFLLGSLFSASVANMPQLLLHTLAILVLGNMVARWGGAKLAQNHRVLLLRDVSQLSNPRFGVDQTIVAVMEKTRAFFDGSSCILVMRDKESHQWSLRTVLKDNAMRTNPANQIAAEVASPLMTLPPDRIVLYALPVSPMLSWTGKCLTFGKIEGKWSRRIVEQDKCLAELLEADSFITVPLSSIRAEGRIYVVSSKHLFSKADALFLNHIVHHAFPVIENIDLLDRLASEAGMREREKIGRDLHDTTIQSYIGLRHGLNSVWKKAAADNPLIADLKKLEEMMTETIDNLRIYAGTFNNRSGVRSVPIFLPALLQQAAQVKTIYGIDFKVRADCEFNVSDRLAVEILQIVNEGMNNICKHTSAQRGFINLQCEKGVLAIQIENQCTTAQLIEFIPHSISKRVTALGGRAYVEQGLHRKTVVHIEIPV